MKKKNTIKKRLSSLTVLALAAAITSATNVSAQEETVNIPVEADAMVKSSHNSDYSFGTLDNLNTKTKPSKFVSKKSFLRFDLSSIPAGVNIKSAKLRLYVQEANGPNAERYVLFARPVENDNWLEAGPGAITWNNAPEPELGNQQNFSGAIAGEYIEINFVNMVTREKKKDGKMSILINSPFPNGDINIKFSSKESPNEAFRPVLTVVYEPKEYIIPVEADAMVKSLHRSDHSFGTLDNLNTKTKPSEFVSKKSFLRFDLSSIPAAVNIKSAKLRLYVQEANGPNAERYGLFANHVENDNWVEAGPGAITWNNAPERELGNRQFFYGAIAGEYIEVDLFSMVTREKKKDDKMSILINSPFPNGDINIKFSSKESPNEAFRPVLIINEKAGSSKKRISNLTETFETTNEMSLFPNPANEQINIAIENPGVDGNMNVSVINLLGTAVYNQQHAISEDVPFNSSLPLNDLKPGIYLMNVTINNKPYSTQRFVKN